MRDGREEAAFRYQVLADEPLPDEMLVLLGVDCQVHVWPADSAGREPLLARTDGLFTYGHPRIDGRLLDHMPRLRVISNFGVGVDHIDLAAARQRAFPLAIRPASLTARPPT